MPAFTHPSRREQVPANKSSKKKKEKPAHISGPALPKAHKVNPTKRRIRDLERLLAKDRNIPPATKIEKERELASMKQQLVDEEAEIRRSQMIKRYHMVRFFESKKAERRLQKVRREAENAETPEDKIRAQKIVHEHEVDANYTKFYPFLKPYHALYRRAQGQVVKEEDWDIGGKNRGRGVKGDDDEEESTRGNQEIWRQVELAMENGTLEALRDSQAEDNKRARDDDDDDSEDGGVALPPEPVKAKKPKGKNIEGLPIRKKAGRTSAGEESGDSDGEFFE